MKKVKNNYSGFFGWLRYIRDYKDNIDNDLITEQRLIDANRKIEKLKKDIEKIKRNKGEEKRQKNGKSNNNI